MYTPVISDKAERAQMALSKHLNHPTVAEQVIAIRERVNAARNSAARSRFESDAQADIYIRDCIATLAALDNDLADLLSEVSR